MRLSKPFLKKPLIAAAAGICLILLAISSIKVFRYAADEISQRNSANDLRALYYADADASGPEGEGAAALETAAASFASDDAQEPGPARSLIAMLYDSIAAENNKDAAEEEEAYLPAQSYPLNRYGIIYSRFEKLRRQNKDIIGWLTIVDMLDQAVVKRDNEYYLRRDSLGYHNVNGALFLDENCDLSVRPYTYIIYGHNMKNGDMFGSLRKYENVSYYKNNPFITFDTMHEDGEYIVFAASKISIVPGMENYINIRELSQMSVREREEAIERIRKYSFFKVNLDIQADDQLLLLVTCDGDDNERLIVSARRIRENEGKPQLENMIQNAFKGSL
ncbi:MAG: class B sortase [Clostridia bacterium]|nr:class B sortase [Clostridia bacterium]MBR6186717.1 class B sortase [Clostridia bacterium]